MDDSRGDGLARAAYDCVALAAQIIGPLAREAGVEFAVVAYAHPSAGNTRALATSARDWPTVESQLRTLCDELAATAGNGVLQ